MIDLLDGGELVMAHDGFGVLETKRLRWFSQDGNLLGTILSADPIRRIYQSGEGLVVESRAARHYRRTAAVVAVRSITPACSLTGTSDVLSGEMSLFTRTLGHS